MPPQACLIININNMTDLINDGCEVQGQGLCTKLYRRSTPLGLCLQAPYHCGAGLHGGAHSPLLLKRFIPLCIHFTPVCTQFTPECIQFTLLCIQFTHFIQTIHTFMVLRPPLLLRCVRRDRACRCLPMTNDHGK
jgi:hypothetical protein